MIRILIIIDREQDRNAVFSTLSAQDDFEIAGLGKDGYDALKLSASLQPDVAVIRLRKENEDKPEFIKMIKRKSSSTAVVVIGAGDDEDHICKAFSGGASGYVLGAAAGDALCNAVRIAHKGGYYITGGILEKTFSRLADLARYQIIYNRFFPSTKKTVLPSCISRTELKIISYIGQGRSIREIAEDLCLTHGTIRNCISSTMRKMGLRNRTQIALFAIRNGLIDLQDQRLPTARTGGRDNGH
jgi:DNA-binding NarL/FixJ family response regulator